jgi:hypothetical protein
MWTARNAIEGRRKRRSSASTADGTIVSLIGKESNALMASRRAQRASK